MIMPSESKFLGVCCAFLVVAFSCSLTSASPDGHFSGYYDDDGDDSEAEGVAYVKRGGFPPTYLRNYRMDNSHFLRALRAPGGAGGSSHFLRSLRAPSRSSHFLRSLRGPPGSASHFLRSLRGPGGSSSHFLRSLRSPSGGSSHFLRSLRSQEQAEDDEEATAAADKRALNNAHFLRSL